MILGAGVGVSLIVFPAILVGVWLLLLITLRRVPLWFFAGAIGVACVLVVMGIMDWRSHTGDHADLGTSGYLPAGLIRYIGNAALGLLAALALACLMSVVEAVKETRQRRATESPPR